MDEEVFERKYRPGDVFLTFEDAVDAADEIEAQQNRKHADLLTQKYDGVIERICERANDRSFGCPFRLHMVFQHGAVLYRGEGEGPPFIISDASYLKHTCPEPGPDELRYRPRRQPKRRPKNQIDPDNLGYTAFGFDPHEAVAVNIDEMVAASENADAANVQEQVQEAIFGQMVRGAVEVDDEDEDEDEDSDGDGSDYNFPQHRMPSHDDGHPPAHERIGDLRIGDTLSDWDEAMLVSEAYEDFFRRRLVKNVTQRYIRLKGFVGKTRLDFSRIWGLCSLHFCNGNFFGGCSSFFWTFSG